MKVLAGGELSLCAPRRGRVNLRRTPTCEMNLLFDGKRNVLIQLKNGKAKGRSSNMTSLKFTLVVVVYVQQLVRLFLEDIDVDML